MYIYIHMIIYWYTHPSSATGAALGPKVLSSATGPPFFHWFIIFFNCHIMGIPFYRDFFFESRCFGSLTTSDLFGISKDVWNQISPEVSRFLARNAGSMVTMVVQWDGIAGLCGTGLINLGAFL
jgi:hypothetical protein